MPTSVSVAEVGWHIREFPNLLLKFREPDKGWVEDIAKQVNTARSVVQRTTGFVFLVPIEVQLAESQAGFIEMVGDWAENSVAVAIGGHQRIIVNMEAFRTRAADQLPKILIHELTHLFLDVKCNEKVPRWMHEGIAQVVAGERGPEDASAIYMASIFKRLIPFEDLKGAFPVQADRQALAYQQSHAFVQYIIQAEHGGVLRLFLESITGEEGRKVLRSYSDPMFVGELEKSWLESLRGWKALPLLTLNSGLFWGVVVLLTLIAWGVRRIRSNRLRTEWEEEERVLQILDEVEEPGWKADPELFEDEDEEKWRGNLH